MAMSAGSSPYDVPLPSVTSILCLYSFTGGDELLGAETEAFRATLRRQEDIKTRTCCYKESKKTPWHWGDCTLHQRSSDTLWALDPILIQHKFEFPFWGGKNTLKGKLFLQADCDVWAVRCKKFLKMTAADTCCGGELFSESRMATAVFEFTEESHVAFPTEGEFLTLCSQIMRLWRFFSYLQLSFWPPALTKIDLHDQNTSVGIPWFQRQRGPECNKSVFSWNAFQIRLILARVCFEWLSSGFPQVEN